jgi:hypothetical protein
VPTTLRRCQRGQSRSFAMQGPRYTGLLLSLWLIHWSGPRLTAVRVPRSSLRKPGPPRLLLGSTSAILPGSSETKSANFLCQTLEVLRSLTFNGQAFLPSQRSSACSLFNWVLFGCPTRSLRTRTIIESQTSELSVFCKLISVLSISGPTIMGVL